MGPGPRSPWSATFPKMMLIFLTKQIRKETNEADDLLIILFSYDDDSFFFFFCFWRRRGIQVSLEISKFVFAEADRPLCLKPRACVTYV